MNFSFYIFGTPEGRYSQYPDDYTASTLAGLQEGMAGARLVIYREMDLVHYAYTERLGNNNVIGFCLIFNKARIQKPRQLIQLFRFIIEKRLVESGEIIKYTDDGELRFKVRSMNECIKTYNRLKGFLNSEFENNASKYVIEPLTTIYNGVRSTGGLDRNASDGQIVALTNQHNKVIVNDDNGIEHGYIPQVIESLKKQNDIANEKIVRLLEANTKLERKKKQYGFLVLLALIVLGCGVGLFFLNNNLKSTRSELDIANQAIINKDSEISNLNSIREELDTAKQTIINKDCEISNLNSIIENKNREIEQEKERYSDLESEIASVEPFVITGVEIGSTYKGGDIETDYGYTLYKSRARYLTPKVYYRGFTSGSCTIKTKWYGPNGSLIAGDTSPDGYSQSKNCSFSKGSDYLLLQGWGWESAGNWESGKYKLEIWCNDKCLFTKTFTIYS